ncbi:TPA: hypothetical protein N0F65_008590 [Lagenidium giganteum]|uniref:Tc1-like transposase DDE domain-containing protein n=1 Tax=Lagenidium giganteum TaxID=4803 RepID=A0AAV2YXP5_9STRA|nr:TPA: hypothetical protein N0F65_008590 [Lagenidium giganteum]
MDGAKYHKRNVNLAPNSNAKKEEMQRWLLHHEHAFDEGFEHEIVFTPPYHPELQSIELIWGSVKHRGGLDPPTSTEDLHAKVWAGLNAQGSAAWVAAYRHVQTMEKKYLGLTGRDKYFFFVLELFSEIFIVTKHVNGGQRPGRASRLGAHY